MSAAQLIARAEHALRTGQPMHAERCMRRASEYLEAERAKIKQDYRAARIKADPWAGIGFAAYDLNKALIRAGENLREVMRAVAPKVVYLAESVTQADFTLAGPSKGGGA